MNFLGIGSIINNVGKIADDLMTSDEERLKLEIASKKIDAELMMGQMEVNKTEAKHNSIFVAGWRPAVGWVCGLGLAYAAILEPFLRFCAAMFGYDGEFPVIDNTLMSQVLVGMLGLGAMRSHDKKLGTQTDSVK